MRASPLLTGDLWHFSNREESLPNRVHFRSQADSDTPPDRET